MIDVKTLQLLGCVNEIMASCYNEFGKLRSLVVNFFCFDLARRSRTFITINVYWIFTI